MPEQDYAFNLSRIFLGNLPWFYVAEVVLRTTVMYFYALLLVRLLGKRGMGQLAPFDFVTSSRSARPSATRCSIPTCRCCTAWRPSRWWWC
jgi:hypothetical protein